MSFTIRVYIIESKNKQRILTLVCKKMTQNLLSDMYYAAPELWYAIWVLFGLLLFLLFYLAVSMLKLKQKNYFLKRDKERYIETLYASQDGYLAFIYPDEKINDPRKKIIERCSRRLAVMLNLPEGTKSDFEDILKCFYKDDAKKIQKYIDMLHSEGISFEDRFMLKNGNCLRLSGSRISDANGNVYCDMVWFRDVSFETTQINELQADCRKALNKALELGDIMDNLAYPVWLRDENLNLKLVNKKYLDYTDSSVKDDIISQNIEIIGTNNESISKSLAEKAQHSVKLKKQNVHLVKNGERRSFDVTEIPFHAGGVLDKIYSVGSMVDITELDDLKQNLKLHQNAHLEILGALGTAFAVFDAKKKLSYYNKSFVSLWGLDEAWLEDQPSYAMFLDEIREKRMLPEVPDFIMYKNGEQNDFNSILEAKEDLLHLPDGRTIRRVRAQHPMGGLVFAFEDVTDRLATRRAYNALISIQREILDNLTDSVIIFGPNGRLLFYNKAYLSLWNCKEIFLQNDPTIPELVESFKGYFSNYDNWNELKNDIVEHISSSTTKSFNLTRNDKVRIEVISAVLSDGSIMVTQRKENASKY